MDKPLSQERLSEDIRSDDWVDKFEVDYRTHVPMFGYVENSDLAPIIKSHRAMSAEVKRLQAIEADYIALKEIMDRARRLAFLQAEEDEPGPRFRMDANGNLERINE